ncbi:MAG: SRPBCC domain-containing protein, partial [Gallionella sp.]
MKSAYQPDSGLDLTFERIVDVPKEFIWRAWTQPEHLKPWFCPLPWRTVDCEIDLRPGGMFRTVMRSPEGQEFPNTGCYLEVVENERLVWTNALLPGFRPAPAPAAKADELTGFFFTAMVTLAAHGSGTR